MKGKRVFLILAIAVLCMATAQADIVITEVMINPMVSADTNGEWFELHNNGAGAVDLTGWTVSDNDGESFTISSLTVDAGDYVVLGRHGSGYYNGNTPVDYVYAAAMSFDEVGDEILVYDDQSTLIDEVWYDGNVAWSFAEGASIQLTDPSSDNNDPLNWVISEFTWNEGNYDFGTPGAAFDGPYDTPDLVISELMYQTNASAEENGEWFELYNAGSSATNLRLWTFASSNEGQEFTIGVHLTVEAGDYIVLGRNSSGYYNGGAPVDWAYGSAILFENEADELVITDPYGDLHNAIHYDELAGWPTANGASMQLTDLGADNDDPANWTLSRYAWPNSHGDFGTPGEAFDGPYYDHDLVISEIMHDPYASADENGEWFELYNAGQGETDLRLWEFVSGEGEYFRVPNSIVVLPGDYIVFGRTTSTYYNGGAPVDYAYSTALIFDDESDTLTIIDPFGNIHDEIMYDEAGSWPEPFGRSMQLTDLEADNNDGSNWSVSIHQWSGSHGDYGTPGYVNDGAYPVPQIIVSEIMYDPLVSSDTYGEWFELHNAGTDTVDVRYWEFYDLNAEYFFPTSNLVIPPGEEVTLGRNVSGYYNGGAPIDYAYGNALIFDNDADEIVVKDPHGMIIDEVYFDIATDFPSVEGASIYLPDVMADNNIGTSWHISTLAWTGSHGDFGSPSEENQSIPAPYTFVISEIMVDPEASADQYGEWFELFNNGPEDVNLRLWEFYDNDGESFIIPTNVFIGTNEYIVLGRNSNTYYNGGVSPMAYEYGTAMSFDNDEDELLMKDIHNNVVDEVGWDTNGSWPLTPGASMYLINPYEDNNVGTSWAASTEAWPDSHGDFGSPNVGNVAALLDITPTVDVIPATGGDMIYDVHIISYLPIEYPNVHYKTEVTLPGGTITIPLLDQAFTLIPFMNITIEDITTEVPPGAPAGEYTYSATAGYPTAYVSDSFTFVKEGTTGAAWDASDWSTTSWFGTSDAQVVSEAPVLPTVFSVGNAYPNPFNPTTSLNVALPEAGELTVEMYNVTGQLVNTVTRGIYQAGHHLISVDGSQLASGVYFVRVAVPGQMLEMRKIVLMK